MLKFRQLLKMGGIVQQDDQDIQNNNLVNDDVASQLADLNAQATTPVTAEPTIQEPGQQFTPDPAMTTDQADEQTTAIGSDLPDLNMDAVEPSQTSDEQPVGYQPPTDQEDNVAPELADQLNQAVESIGDSVETETPTADDSTPTMADEPVIDEPTPTLTMQLPDNDDAEPSELEDLKKQALSQLKPLVDKIDLTPEKRYDLLMEIIQASDDKSLVQKAYEAAQKIEDEDLKAQALMEIVNEIEYLEGDSKV